MRSTVVPGEENRGGTAILIRNSLWPGMYNISLHKDQILFKLKQVPGFSFAAIYVPPRDSPFFTNESLAIINEHCCNPHDPIVLIGDFNARLGKLDDFADVMNGCTYSDNPDMQKNTNGNELRSLMKANGMMPVNGLETCGRSFERGLTFRKGRSWISQVDWAIATPAALPHIHSFKILNSINIPTDHAPLEMTINRTCISEWTLLNRATDLGDSFLPQTMGIRAIRMSNVNMNNYAHQPANCLR